MPGALAAPMVVALWAIGGGGHEDWAAGDDAGGDFGAIIGGVDDAGSFGIIILCHAADFSAGAKGDNVVDEGVSIAALGFISPWGCLTD